MAHNLDGVPRPRSSVLRRAATLAGGLFCAGILATACGGGPASPSVVGAGSSTTSLSSAPAGNSGPPPSPKLQKAQLAYSVCMRSHGVKGFPDPLTGGGYPNEYMHKINPNSSAYVSATKDCEPLARSADMAPYTKAQMAAHIAVMLKIAECMRSHGVTGFPDPDATGGFSVPVGASSSSIDQSSPQYAAAAKACNGPPGTPPGSAPNQEHGG